MHSEPIERNRRILVIDDNRSIHEDFRKILSPAMAATEVLDATETALFGSHDETITQSRFEIDSAYQGEEGVLLVKRACEAGRPYAMAFVDVRMPPGLDGVETTMKMWDLDSNIQVVLCTAYSDYSWGEMFEKLGHRDGLLILKKPFDGVEAFQLASALTEKWWLHQEALGKMEELERRVAGRTHELRQTNLALASDITERKHAEKALRSSEARTKAIVQSSLDCIVTIDEEGKIIEFNPAAEIVFGYSRDKVLGVEMAGIMIPPSLREQHRQGMKRYLATGEARVLGQRIEIVAMRSEGREFPVELAITRLEAEGPPTFTAFIRDISDRKRAERQFDLQYRISRVLAESSTAEQATGRILQVVCEALGWDLSALWTVGPQENVLRWVEMWSAPGVPMEEFKAVSREMTFAQGVGLPGRVWASGQAAWIGDVVQDGNFTRALVGQRAGLHTAFAFPILIGTAVSGVIEMFSRDVLDCEQDLRRTLAVLGSQLGQFFQRRQLEDQLFQSQKLETVGKLAGGIAHEFNSILTAIIGQSDLLLADLPPGSPLRESAMDIGRAAGRAGTLTRQLLAYGRKQFLQPETLDLNEVIANMEGVFRHILGEDVDTRVIRGGALKKVKADAGQIEQVIMNMAMNARDAMPEGGRVTLETANVSFDEDSAGGYPELKPGDYVMLAITDSGSGMVSEVRSRVFEPFFSTKGVGQGTGLGLSTCYGIIKQSGGHISVYSEPGRGTTFKCYLPQVEDHVRSGAQTQRPFDLPHGTETILLVEDDPALRQMAATLLKRLGYRVLSAANGIEALSLRQQREVEHIDLLFTDLVMPRMSGQELAEQVRVLSPNTRILFTSGYTKNAIVHEGLLKRGVEVLQKPFTPGALAHKLREVLDRPGPSRVDAAQEAPGLTRVADVVDKP